MSSAAIDQPAGVAADAERISGLLRSNDLATPIPHLARWKVRDVAAHLGGVHRWATRIIVNRSMDGPGFKKSKLDGTELCDWFDQGAAELVGVLRANDHCDPCPNFNPGSTKTVGWWARRQLHETSVHRWDIEHALDCTTPIAPDLAADGIDEFLDTFVRTRGKQTLTAAIEIRSTYPAQAWGLTLAAKPGRLDVEAGGSHEPAATISGPPDQLLLHLWGRLPLTEAALTVDGDRDVAASLIASS